VIVMFDSWRYSSVEYRAKTAMEEERWADALALWQRHGRNIPPRTSRRFSVSISRGAILAWKNMKSAGPAEFALAKTSPKSRTIFRFSPSRANPLLKLGRDDEAAETFKKVLALEPSNTEINLLLGRAALEKGRILEAAPFFDAVPDADFPADLRAKMKEIETELLRKAESSQDRVNALAGPRDRMPA
jgi:cytochrome c-type biogenesis protein CcmH/NrfG